ncbi:geminin [Linepithema humile]|uniref:geminin n=1 Tax=Linepithema humile TaxID=83485 RepID=UPI0006234AA7|nr:PREDICTED: geminin [Linepithema humile]
MKTVTGAKTVTNSEDKVRKSLHELQPSATNKEILVGADRMVRSTEQTKEAKLKKDVPKKTKGTSKSQKITTKNQAVQTTPEEKVKIEPEDLTSTDLAGPSENYWQVLAERRRVALKDALEENKILSQRIEKLEEENRIQKEMLSETRALVEVLREAMDDDRNDINNSLEDSLI